MASQGREIFESALGIIAAIFSGSVVFTGLMFPNMMLRSSKPFSHILFFISLSDFIVGLGNSFGYPDFKSELCVIQSITVRGFNVSSWLFTVSLVFQLYSLLITKQVWLKLKGIHLICWGLSILITLLPLSTNKFGGIEKLNGLAHCTLSGDTDARHTWSMIYYSILLICVIILSYLTYLIQIFINSNEILMKNKSALMIAKTTLLYTMNMFICWIPLLLCSIIGLFNRDFIFNSYYYAFLQFSINVSTQNGTILAIIFYKYSPQVTEKYRQYFKYIFEPATKTESLVFIMDEDEIKTNEENIIIEKETSNIILDTTNSRLSDIEIGNVSINK